MQASNKGTGGHTPPEPFRLAAETYLDIGLSVAPCGKADGKMPLVKWQSLQHKHVVQKTLTRWLAAHASANIGIVTGALSNLTVVDSDNPATPLYNLLQTYGETPLVAQTPGGGYHLYYRYNGERCCASKAEQIDIRGQGGFIVAPPSYNPTTGALYHFVMGDTSDIPHLPCMKHQTAVKSYAEGERNIALFKQLKNDAANSKDKQALQERASVLNDTTLEKPLEDKEVERIVASVWKYKQEGKLFTTGKQRLVVDIQKLEPLLFLYPRAVSLYLDLLHCHAGWKEAFAISPKAYAKRCGWSDKTVAEARDILLHYRLIECLKKGGKHKGDVGLFRLST